MSDFGTGFLRKFSLCTANLPGLGTALRSTSDFMVRHGGFDSRLDERVKLLKLLVLNKFRRPVNSLHRPFPKGEGGRTIQLKAPFLIGGTLSPTPKRFNAHGIHGCFRSRGVALLLVRWNRSWWPGGLAPPHPRPADHTRHPSVNPDLTNHCDTRRRTESRSSITTIEANNSGTSGN